MHIGLLVGIIERESVLRLPNFDSNVASLFFFSFLFFFFYFFLLISSFSFFVVLDNDNHLYPAIFGIMRIHDVIYLKPSVGTPIDYGTDENHTGRGQVYFLGAVYCLLCLHLFTAIAHFKYIFFIVHLQLNR